MSKVIMSYMVLEAIRIKLEITRSVSQISLHRRSIHFTANPHAVSQQINIPLPTNTMLKLLQLSVQSRKLLQVVISRSERPLFEEHVP